MVLSAAYMLWMYRRVVFGKIQNTDLLGMKDLSKSELIVLWVLALPIVIYGFYPEPLFNTINTSVSSLLDTYNLNLENYLAQNK